MLVIFLFSHQPHSGRETEKYFKKLNVPIRKTAHVGEYTVLFLLLRWALSGSEERQRTARLSTKPQDGSATTCDSTPEGESAALSSNCKLSNGGRAKSLAPGARAARLIAASVIAAIYAASDEFHQSFIPGRSSTSSDVLVDFIGIALGVCVWIGLKRAGCISGERAVKR